MLQQEEASPDQLLCGLYPQRLRTTRLLQGWTLPHPLLLPPLPLALDQSPLAVGLHPRQAGLPAGQRQAPSLLQPRH